MRKCLHGFLLVCLAFAPARIALGDEAQPVVAVFEIENRGTPLDPDEIQALTDYLASRLGEGGLFRIVPRDEIKKRLVQVKAESYSECKDLSCQVEIGRELAAQMTVTTSVGRIGDTCVVSSGLYDLAKAATLRTASARGPCTSEEMLERIGEIAAKLQGKKTVSETSPRLSPEVPTTGAVAPLPPRERKSIWVAFAWSMMPTAGMYYAGEWEWGIVYTTLFVGGLISGTVLLSYDEYRWIGFGLASGSMGVTYIASMIHAMIAAAAWRPPEPEPTTTTRDFSTVPAIAPGFDPHRPVVFPVFGTKF
jgi:hypothetical protein